MIYPFSPFTLFNVNLPCGGISIFLLIIDDDDDFKGKV